MPSEILMSSDILDAFGNIDVFGHCIFLLEIKVSSDIQLPSKCLWTYSCLQNVFGYMVAFKLSSNTSVAFGLSSDTLVAFSFAYARMTLPHDYRGCPNCVVLRFVFSGRVYLPEFC
ncbi:hypothetical protein L3X38_018010 [Prunus dulcis]|uniref:Uncharacterized protein n=1 Tax=Prunus dulcis TaxID=3755 RepID=A0AAD4ZB91_PRUDU|nr:hypothetical protein L3X38_018010 [Prunus dulcis]